MIKKLMAIQAELKAPKGRKNKFGNYNYRSCEDILEAVKPLLAKNDCALILRDEILSIDGRFYVKAIATLCGNGGGEITTTAYAREEDVKKGMDAAQVTGTASSYARKYALNGLFCIDDTKDADTDEYTETQRNAAKAEKPKAETYRDKIVRYVTENGLDMNEFAARHKLTRQTTENEYKALFEALEGGAK